MPSPRPAVQASAAKPNLEDALTSRWLVWLGAVAIALSGVFLVKYAIDRQLLTPAARIVLGLVLGLALALGGEVLRRKPMQRAIAAVQPNYVPPALTASGLFIAFVSIYAAYNLYLLIGPLVAFAALAFVALLAVGLSLLHGRFVALMGLLGAFVTPGLIETPHPSAWALFSYLLVVEVACLAVVRYRQWWWLAFATLAAVVTWPLLWLAADEWKLADALPIGAYLVLSAAAFFSMRIGLPDPPPQENWLDEIRRFDVGEKAVFIAGCALALLVWIVADAADYNVVSRIVALVAAALYLFAGRREGPYDALALVAGAMALLIVASLPVPETLAHTSPAIPAPLIPYELTGFYSTAGLFALLFGVFGFVVLWGARRPAMWAGVSAGVPVLLLVIAYWRIVDFGLDMSWAVIAVILAAINLVAAERVERYRTARGLDVALGFYAAAVAAALGLAAAMLLQKAWLTVALSLELPALAWISTRTSARAIRFLAGVVVGIVLVRLALNQEILDYPLSGFLLSNWIIYGYGIPALCCFGAAYLFAKSAKDQLVVALQAAGLAFSVLLVSFEIRYFITGSLRQPSYGLLEQSLQSIAWLAIGVSLAVHGSRSGNMVSRYGSNLLLIGAIGQIVLLQLLGSNPWTTGEPVGHYPLFNVLALAYLVPAIFAFYFAATVRQSSIPHAREIAAVAGFVLFFVYISFEVRRFYHGPVLSGDVVSDAELYTYSVVWLIYAVVLLGLGFFLRQPIVRYASVAVLLIVSLKVFLLDMSGLTGLLRVASFLGLGLSLVGIGYLYQRFLLAPKTAPPAA